MMLLHMSGGRLAPLPEGGPARTALSVGAPPSGDVSDETGDASSDCPMAEERICATGGRTPARRLTQRMMGGRLMTMTM